MENSARLVLKRDEPPSFEPPGLGAIAAALAKAQPDFKPVKRERTVTVRKRDGGQYTFSYAPLDVVLAAVQPALSANGLAVVQLIDGGYLVTMLLHESGAYLEGRTALPDGVDAQALGSAITYLRRYAVQALLGIAAEEDDDGNRAAGNETEAAPPRPDTGRASPREAEAYLGLLASKSGVIRKGTANGYKLERREGPEGPVFGFRFELAEPEEDGSHKAIPQVLVPPKVAVPLLADVPDPAEFDGRTVTLRGQLYSVAAPGRTTFTRLVVTEWHDGERKIAPERPA